MKAIDRLYQYLDSKRVKPTNFERELGLSNGYLSSQKKRGADMGESIIVKITDYCRDMSLEWFLTGRGEMLRRADGEPITQKSELVTVYLDNPDKAEIIELQRDKIKFLEAEVRDLKKEREMYISPNTSNTPPVEPVPLAASERKVGLHKYSKKDEIHV